MNPHLPLKELTLEQIRDIVRRRAVPEFLGALENEFIDFKGEPYRLDDEKQRLELAKDVSAFANTSGGFIILGVKTTKDPEYNADFAEELRPIPKNLLNQEQYENVVRDWIYPPINDLRIDFVQGDDSGAKGFFVLEIPPSAVTSRPFLIVRGTDDNNRKDRRITFGYAERFQSNSLPAVVQRLQQLLHLGIKLENFESFQQGLDARFGELSGRMERLEVSVLRQVKTDEHALRAERDGQFEKSIESAAIETAMNNRPRLILGAVPEQPLELPSFFSSANDPLVSAFENPPKFRDSGFDFGLRRPSEILPGRPIRRIVIPGYKSIQLATTGELIVLVPGDDDFLAWASMSKPDSAISINSFVLAEVTYVFTCYVKQLYEFAMPRPLSVKLYIGLDDMLRGDKLPTLSSLESGPYVMISEHSRRKAPSPKCLLFAPVPFSETAERMAFLLRATLYHWFGFDDQHIPYTRKVDGVAVVDRKSIFKTLANQD